MKLPDLELIGIHIKKTDGMSFKELLKTQYGKNYYRINVRPQEKNRAEYIKRKLAEIPAEARVIHGHFKYRDITGIIRDNPNAAVVAWLREPIERLVSQYYYGKYKFQEGRKNTEFDFEQISIIDFVKDPKTQNRISRTLAGADLADFKFVGLLAIC